MIMANETCRRPKLTTTPHSHSTQQFYDAPAPSSSGRGSSSSSASSSTTAATGGSSSSKAPASLSMGGGEAGRPVMDLHWSPHYSGLLLGAYGGFGACVD